MKCRTCVREAECIGAYEGSGPVEPSCGGCCGHGNEDGWCEPILTLVVQAIDIAASMLERSSRWGDVAVPGDPIASNARKAGRMRELRRLLTECGR